MTLPENSLPAVSLDDKYLLSEGTAFMSGTQALVRLPLVQRRRDMAAGLNTAGFISGYRGSPLGGYDQALMRARGLLGQHDITFQPGVNEDLAATAVWGSQQVNLFPGARHDGVFGIWYGKGPGVDRSGDVLRHANAAGTSRHGGVLAIAGDDHGCKSSTLPHQTDHTFYGVMMPILYPSSLHEFVEYGLLGIAMSRFSGCWVAYKVLAETVEVSASVSLAGEQREILIPDASEFEMPPEGVNIRVVENWKDHDYLLQRYKLFAAIAFAKKNRINRVIWDSPRPRFGIITSGKSYEDVRQALGELGITEAVAREIGLRLYKIGMPWPIEPDGVRQFSEGLEEVLVVEEKRELIENQIKQQLFNWRADVRPLVVGKVDEKGDWLLHPENDLTVAEIAHVLASRLSRFVDNDHIRAKLAFYAKRAAEQRAYKPELVRKPYFCSGCPHNTSTRVPDGSRAMAGIGCHIMATWMDRSTSTYTHMGGEGVPWVGQAPFTEERHIFANLGDGTYFHSGLLAIRQAVAAGVNITYKILFNHAVAMTGGQPFDGPLSVPQIARQAMAEGVRKVVVVTDEPDKYPADANFPEGTAIHHRDALDGVQKDLREVPGTTVIIYDQTCAAEKRRRRKRGSFPDPAKRVIINEAVCEGCGDCSVQSNCVSVEPVETEFGRKRRINQSACNKDFSCLKGFCPSFVTVHGGKLRKAEATDLGALAASLPEPALPPLDDAYNILVTGIGGTGVVTIGALLGMAAHLENKAVSVLDMAGLAQKGGAVYGHLRIGSGDKPLHTPKITTGAADLVLACDPVVAASPEGVEVLSPERSAGVINAHQAPVAGFVRDRDFDFREEKIRRSLQARLRPDATHFVDGTQLATAIIGDAIATNLFMLGYAWQKGHVPLGQEAITQAITLNGGPVDANLQSFAAGRVAAHDPDAVRDLLPKAAAEPLSETLDQVIARRVAFLTDYQDAAYAVRYREMVERVRAAEQRIAPGEGRLAEAVARNLFKLMAYKDEYEVARLYTSGAFQEALERQFEGDYRIEFNLAPPLLARMDPLTGRPRKMRFGPWMLKLFRVLAGMRKLRGTVFDIFGYHPERRMERALLSHYEELLEMILGALSGDNHAAAVELARLPDEIRGFGPVKAASVERAEARRDELLARFQGVETAERSAA